MVDKLKHIPYCGGRIYSCLTVIAALLVMVAPWISCFVGYSNYQLLMFADESTMASSNNLVVCKECNAKDSLLQCKQHCENALKPSWSWTDNEIFRFFDDANTLDQCYIQGGSENFGGQLGERQVCIKFHNKEDCVNPKYPISLLLTHVEVATVFLIGIMLQYVVEIESFTYTQSVYTCALYTQSVTIEQKNMTKMLQPYNNTMYLTKVIEAAMALMMCAFPMTIPPFVIIHGACVIFWWGLMGVTSLWVIVICYSALQMPNTSKGFVQYLHQQMYTFSIRLIGGIFFACWIPFQQTIRESFAMSFFILEYLMLSLFVTTGVASVFFREADNQSFGYM